MRTVLCLVLLVCACRSMTPDEYARVELGLLRPGVELKHEEEAVRRVLRQRHLDVVDEVRGTGFVALGAESLDGRLTAVRVITPRGVVVAEDGARDDLFAPSQVALARGFGPRHDDQLLIGITRKLASAALGCLSLFRLLHDASAVRAVFDLAPLGSRACVASLTLDEAHRVRAEVAWPGLSALGTPSIQVVLSFVGNLPGRPAEPIPTLRLAEPGAWLDEERARVDALPVEGPFSARHALGVSRAALARLSGLDVDTQLGAYSTAVGRVLPGSFEAEVVADTSRHIKDGWLDADELDAHAQPAIDDDAEVIEPEGPAREP